VRARHDRQLGLVVRNADAAHPPRRERAIVVAAAVTEPHALRAEADAGDDQQVGLDLVAGGRLRNLEATLDQRRAR